MEKAGLAFWKSIAAMQAIALLVCAIASVNCVAQPQALRDRQQNNNTAAGEVRLPVASVTTGSQAVPPAVILDTQVAQSSGRRRIVAGGADGARNLQAALDSASPGDLILLEAGATFTGNFVLPKKPDSNFSWITIRSNLPDDQLGPAGSRIAPAKAGSFAKLVTANADPVLKTAPGAHHFRFTGVEFTQSPATSMTYDLIQLGTGQQMTLGEVPHDLVFDRCYIHGNARANLRRGVALNSARTAIIDSYIADCHERGADSQAICGWNGPGPFKIVNNYLEGAGENVMFGGADPKIANLVPSDIEFRRNHCFKPLTWKKSHPSYAGQAWSVKNIFELKNARRVLIEGNLFENNWVEAQSGYAVLFTVRNQEGSAPWCTVEDITFTNNVVRHSSAAINLLGRDNNNDSQQVRRVLIQNNLVYDIGGKTWGGNGGFLQITETRDVLVDHNTVMQKGNIITGYGVPNEGFVFTNNLVAHNEYGIIGDGTGPGTATLNKYFPNLTFKKNALAGGLSRLYPGDNFFPASPDEAGLTLAPDQSFSITVTVPFKKNGTDGSDIGCNREALRQVLEQQGLEKKI